MNTTTRTGSRIALPTNALRVCASCGAARGNVRKDWNQITREGAIIGWTCPICPAASEPIRREPSGRLVAVVRGTVGADGRRHQHKRRFDTLTAARDWVEEVRQGVTTATRRGAAYGDPSRFTVRIIAERWLDRRAEEVGTPGGIREVTLNGYRSALHALLLHMGDRVAREVTTDDVESLLRVLATDGGAWGRGLSHRSIVYALGALRQAFNYGMRQGWLHTNPATLAKAPRRNSEGKDGGSRRAKRWTAAQMVTFRAHVDTYADGAQFAAEPWLVVGMRLALCGMRRSEVLGLDWSNVDRDAGTVTVAASRVKTGRGSATALGGVKTDNSRRVVQAEVIHPGTLRALRALWMVQGRPESGLVIRDAVGEPVHPDLFSRRFKALCTAAGVPDPGSIHNTRHTLATTLQEAGVPDNQGAALLGHDVNTYRRFYVLTDQDAAAGAAEVAG